MTYVYPGDNRTIGCFTKAEFSNSWAVHRGKVFKVDKLTPFHQEFDEWLAEHDAQVIANLENGVLPEGYMIVSVRDLTDSVTRAFKEATK